MMEAPTWLRHFRPWLSPKKSRLAANDQINKCHATASRDKPTAEQHPFGPDIASAVNAFARDYKASHASDAEHNRQIQVWTRRGAVAACIYTLLTLFILAATVYAAWQSRLAAEASRAAVREAHQQAVQAQRQADLATDQLVATIRPWLLPNITPNSVDIGQNNIALDFNLIIKNSGRIPVFTPITDFNVMPTPTENWDQLVPILRQMCGEESRQMAARSRYGLGTTMPPDAEWVQHRHVKMSIIPQKSRSTIIAYGCVAYGFQGSPIPIHVTGLIFEVGLKDPKNDVSLLGFDFEHAGVINGDALRVSREYIGTQAD